MNRFAVSVCLSVCSQSHDELREDLRVVVLHVEGGELHGAVAAGDGHDLDHLKEGNSRKKVELVDGLWAPCNIEQL